MELGEKIRIARQEKGFSQRQLCADRITRNMLSLIESGRARPSMDTLLYLAERLEKPLGYFLGEDAPISGNAAVMDNARRAYQAGEYRAVLAIFEDYKAPDGVFDAEYKLLLALALMGAAEKALEEGRTLYARELLTQAGGCDSLYWDAAQERRRRILLAKAGEEISLAAEDEVLLLQAEQAFQMGAVLRCIHLLEAVQNQDAQWFFLRGRAAMAQSDYPGAATWLTQAEQGKGSLVYPLLEECYRQLEDYKMAYHYACLQKNG